VEGGEGTCGPESCGGAAEEGDGAVSGFGGGTRVKGVSRGVGGPDDAGDGDSTIHIRWDFVATSLPIVCARVE
jgi:hypothetical protein